MPPRLVEDAPKACNVPPEELQKAMALRALARQHVPCGACQALAKERCRFKKEYHGDDWEWLTAYDVHAVRWQAWLALPELQRKMLEATQDDPE